MLKGHLSEKTENENYIINNYYCQPIFIVFFQEITMIILSSIFFFSIFKGWNREAKWEINKILYLTVWITFFLFSFFGLSKRERLPEFVTIRNPTGGWKRYQKYFWSHFNSWGKYIIALIYKLISTLILPQDPVYIFIINYFCQDRKNLSELSKKYKFNNNSFPKVLYLLGYFQLQVTEKSE